MKVPVFLIVFCGCLWLADTGLSQALVAREDVLAVYLYNGMDEARFKKHLEQRAELQIDQIVQVIELDEAQQAKLRWAARGDLSRFYREMDRVREKLKDLDPRNGNDMQKAWQEIQPLQQRVSAGIINESSLMKKVLSTVLTPVQVERYRANERSRQLYRYKSILRMTIADLEKSMPLTAQQRTDLITLLEGKNFPVDSRDQMDVSVGYAMLSRLSRQEQQRLFDAGQQKVFAQVLERFGPGMHNFKW